MLLAREERFPGSPSWVGKQKGAKGMRKVLVIEDDPAMQELLRLYLSREGYAVMAAFDGETGLAMAAREDPDLVLLDIMLPGADGWEVCKKIRQVSYVPVIMVTAKGEEIDRILGLELGADDYITKPFSPRELVARIKAMFRRIETLTELQREQANQNRLSFDGLKIEGDLRRVTLDGTELTLTPKEFDLLWFLAENPGRVFTREQLLEQVWGYSYLGDGRTVDTLVKRLRKKLKPGGKDQLIATVWGVGYKFQPGGAK
jgi:two-component system response regulator ResD